jgi:hypothetical protein
VLLMSGVLSVGYPDIASAKIDVYRLSDQILHRLLAVVPSGACNVTIIVMSYPRRILSTHLLYQCI